MTAPLAYADLVVRLPGAGPRPESGLARRQGGNKRCADIQAEPSVLLLRSQFELSLHLALDLLATLLFQDSGMTEDDLCSRMFNVE